MLKDRIAYGRRVRHRALCLIEAHGPHAEALARDAAAEFALPAAERAFWLAVADRIARLAAVRPAPGLAATLRASLGAPRSRRRHLPRIVPSRTHAA